MAHSLIGTHLNKLERLGYDRFFEKAVVENGILCHVFVECDETPAISARSTYALDALCEAVEMTYKQEQR